MTREEEPSCEWVLGSHLETDGGQLPSSPFLGREFGRYIIEEEIGRGGFGGVFRAWDKGLERHVAVKILFRTADVAVSRFLREIETLASLRHPGVVRIHDFGKAEGFPFLVMDYLAGRPLSSFCDHEALLPPRRVAEIVRDVAEIVEHAHQEGVIHRDIKPNNVILDEDGKLTVLDFGLAFLRRAEDRLSATGIPVGTPAYMAPEQVEGKLPTKATDVYGLGATLYHLLTGRVPLEGAKTTALLAVATYTPPSPHRVRKSVPRDLSAICMRCLDKVPGDRIRTPGDLAAALDRFLALPPRSDPAWVVPAAVAIAVTALAVGVWVLAFPPTTLPLPTPSHSASPVAQVSAEAERAILLAHELARQRTPPEAILAGLDEAIALAKNDASLHELMLAQARLARCFGFFSETTRISKLLMNEPGEIGLRARYAYSNALSGMGEEASDRGEEMYAELYRDDPTGKYGMTAQAELLVEQGDGEGAIKLCRRVLEIDPAWTPAINALAFGHISSGDYSEARRLGERSVELCPWDPACHITLASALGFLDDQEGALREVNAALDLWGPRAHPLTYGFRSKLYYALRALGKARTDSERVLRARPEHVGALVWHGVIEKTSGNEAAAHAIWKKAFRLDSEKFKREVDRNFSSSMSEQIWRTVRESE